MKRLLLSLLLTGCSWATYPEPECQRKELSAPIKGGGLDLPAGSRVEQCTCDKFEWVVLRSQTGAVVIPTCNGKVIPFVGFAKQVGDHP